MMMRIMPTIPVGFTAPILQRPPAADQLENQNDQRDQEQQMNISAQNVEADKAKQPENQQNNKDSPKHKNLSFEVVANSSFRHAQSRVTKIGRKVRTVYLSAFFRTARKSQPLSSNCVRAEL